MSPMVNMSAGAEGIELLECAVPRHIHLNPHTSSDFSGSALSFLLPTGRGDMEQNESDNRRIIRYPDSHQLFVGNLPHDIDESELKEFFMSKCPCQLHRLRRKCS